MDTEPAKLLLPYLQRADELQKHEPLVAYYCRLYAMERGLKIPANERTKYTNSFLGTLINQLEKDKKSLTLSPDDHLHLEGFALNVFAKADKQDRAGRADINTAKTFYAASIFFEILNQFGALAPDLEQKQKYAVWKAADIRKALKEGRKPVPGPPGGEEDLSSPSSTPSGGYDGQPRYSEHEMNLGPEPDLRPSPQVPDELKRQTSTNLSPSTPSFPSGDYSSHTLDYPSHDHQPRQGSGRLENPTYQPPSEYPSHDHQPGHGSGRLENPTYQPPSEYPSHDYQPGRGSGRLENPTYQPPNDYPSQDHQPGYGSGRPENPTYQQPFQNQTFPPQEPQHPPHFPQNYPSQDIPAPFGFPNFQSYPSFSESSLPAVPTRHPSYHQGSDTSFSQQSVPSVTNPASAPPYSSSGRNGGVQDAPTSAQEYHYDSSYTPPPEKIAEAQKASRFAVGALAFDEVPVAVEHLKKALEYLTNPSAGQ